MLIAQWHVIHRECDGCESKSQRSAEQRGRKNFEWRSGSLVSIEGVEKEIPPGRGIPGELLVTKSPPARCSTSSATQKSPSTPSTAIIFQLLAKWLRCKLWRATKIHWDIYWAYKFVIAQISIWFVDNRNSLIDSYNGPKNCIKAADKKKFEQTKKLNDMSIGHTVLRHLQNDHHTKRMSQRVRRAC